MVCPNPKSGKAIKKGSSSFFILRSVKGNSTLFLTQKNLENQSGTSFTIGMHQQVLPVAKKSDRDCTAPFGKKGERIEFEKPMFEKRLPWLNSAGATFFHITVAGSYRHRQLGQL